MSMNESAPSHGGLMMDSSATDGGGSDEFDADVFEALVGNDPMRNISAADEEDAMRSAR